MRTITLIAFSRPDYTERSLQALLDSRHITSFDRIVISIDPGHDAVRDVCLARASFSPIPVDVIVNSERLGVTRHPRRVFHYVFEILGSDFNVAIEDDAVITGDALGLALWFEREHGDATSRYAFLNLCDHYDYRGAGKNLGGVPSDPALLAESRNLSSPFAWAFTAHGWPFIKRHWNANTKSYVGWDWAVRFSMRIEGRIALTPVLSRCRNIGELGGVHDTPQSWAEVQLGLDHSDGSFEGHYQIVNSVTPAAARKLSSWMIPELARVFGPQLRAAEARAKRRVNNRVLILTPVKDALGCVPEYCDRLRSLTYPRELLSVGLLESDSSDDSWARLQEHVPLLENEGFRRVTLLKHDFGYRVPPDTGRHAPSIQRDRRSIIARSRNRLLLGALEDEEWVLWLDVDVTEYPRDIVERLLAVGKDILQPHCVCDYGGPTFDLNGWRDRARLHLQDLRGEGDLVELDAVGGTMLLVRADLHREGLIFPPFHYGRGHDAAREGGEIETEGLGIMALDMGHRPWGMPNLEILHRKW